MIKKAFPLFYLLFLAFTVNLQAQNWEYYVEDDLHTHPGYSWVDQDGVSYHNIGRYKVNYEKNSTAEVSNHIIGLDKNGNLLSLMQINNCTNTSTLIPFGKNQFLSAGINCNSDGMTTNDARVFDRKGKILHTGPGVKWEYQSSIYTSRGYSIFQTDLAYRSNNPTIDSLFINNFSWDFKYSKQAIDLTPMNVIPGRFFTNIIGHSRPVQSEDDGWVVPMSYCIPDGNGYIPTEGIIMKVKGEKIIWSYPQNPQRAKTTYLKKTQDGYLLLLGEMGTSNSEAHFLNNNGQLIRKLTLPNKGRFQQAVLLEEHLVFLTSSNFRGAKSKLVYYDLEGNLVEERELKNEGPIWISRMMPFGKNSIMITGILTRSEKDRVGFIWKIDTNQEKETTTEKEEIQEPVIAQAEITKAEILEDDEEEIIEDYADVEEEEEEEEATSSIKSSNFDFIDQRALSVSLFPNPTTINVNFVIDNKENPNQTYYLRIFTNTGKTVREQTFSGNELEMDVSELIAGTYFYTIMEKGSDKQKFISGQFVKI